MKTLSTDALIVASRQELIDLIQSQAALIAQLQTTVTELTFKVDWFKRQIFGTKSERFISSDDMQEALDLKIIENEKPDTVPEVTKISYNRESNSLSSELKPGHGRGCMPSHLPIKDVTVEPQGDLSGLVRIGEEVSWYLEMEEPGALHIVRTTRPKYVRPKEDGVIIGKLPAMPVEKGNAGPGLIAQIIIDKCVYHMPLDRQCKKFKNEYNIDFSESWFCDNFKNGTFWLESVYNQNVLNIVKSSYLQADETPIPVLAKDKKGKTHRGYFWVYYDPLKRIVVFDYRKNRSMEGPSEFLKDFKGTLQIDGYEGYSSVISKNGIRHAACMDHVRRRFEKALNYDKDRAGYALDSMREWYAVEREAREKGQSMEERFALRIEHTVPSMRLFKDWMIKQVSEVLPKSPIGTALSYALNQWSFFDPFMTDQRIELSNILIENAIRPVALGRKNFMFAGSHDGAKNLAIVYSLAANAHSHGYDPFVYIKELLSELPKSTVKDIEKYLFPNWKRPIT